MAVKIRLTRIGAKKRPIYRIIVADSRYPRDGRCIEYIGQYDPSFNPPRVNLKRERYDYWVGTGAQPTTVVRNLVKKLPAPAAQ